MKTSIEVKDRKEAQAIQTALADPEVRAFVLVMGTLLPLPSRRAQKRTLDFVADVLSDPLTDARA